MRREKRLSENENRYLKREALKRAKRKRNVDSSPGERFTCHLKGEDSSTSRRANDEGMEPRFVEH
jgi:hypothetical protein